MKNAFVLAGSVLIRALWVVLYIFWGWGVWYRFLAEASAVQKAVWLLLFAHCLTMGGLFFLRKRSTVTSWRVYDLVLTTCGTASPLLFLPAEASAARTVGLLTQIAGYLLMIAAALSLKRSMGALPALRSLRSSGPYALVRHPLYASYMIALTGFTINQFSAHNLAVLVFAFSCEILRAFSEEKLLSADPAYREYMKKVRWRFIPRVF